MVLSHCSIADWCLMYTVCVERGVAEGQYNCGHIHDKKKTARRRENGCCLKDILAFTYPSLWILDFHWPVHPFWPEHQSSLWQQMSHLQGNIVSFKMCSEWKTFIQSRLFFNQSWQQMQKNQQNGILFLLFSPHMHFLQWIPASCHHSLCSFLITQHHLIVGTLHAWLQGGIISWQIICACYFCSVYSFCLGEKKLVLSWKRRTKKKQKKHGCQWKL